MKQLTVFGLLALVLLANAKNIKIIGGEDAEVGAWPFMASLQLNGEHSCGGSLITPEWVVCAAHCTQSPLSDYTVVLGMHNRLDFSIGGPEVYTVVEIINHEDYIYNNQLIANDMSLVRLGQPANLNSPYIELISMAESGDDFTGRKGWIIGWGIDTQGPGGERAVILQQARITVHPNDYCESFYGDRVAPGQICLAESGLVASCSSDSGGPFVVDGILAGVTSWGYAGCDGSWPSVYESISYHREWIRGKINV